MPSMRLDDYLSAHKLTEQQFADLLGISQQAVHRYRRGKRIPDSKIMRRIVQATNGAVSANDFFDEQTTLQEAS